MERPRYNYADYTKSGVVLRFIDAKDYHKFVGKKRLPRRVIFIVDSTEIAQFSEARKVLEEIKIDNNVNELLINISKRDIVNSLQFEEISEAFCVEDIPIIKRLPSTNCLLDKILSS